MSSEKRQLLLALVVGLRKLRQWDDNDLHEALIYIESEASFLKKKLNSK